MTSVKITSKGDEAVQAEIKRLAARVGSPRPILGAIGEILVDSTTKRFALGVGPDGIPWKKNTDLTLDRYADAFVTSRTKKGSRSAAGRRRIGSKKPLIGESRALSTTINHAVSGRTLHVGSPMIYAGVQHFGAKMGEFGRYSQLSRRAKFAEGDFRRSAGTVKGFPIPWGDIPARPFLGLTAEDREDILDSLREMLER